MTSDGAAGPLLSRSMRARWMPRPLQEVLGVDRHEVSAVPAQPPSRRGFCFMVGGFLFFESLNLQLMSFIAPQVAREWGLGPRVIGPAISGRHFRHDARALYLLRRHSRPATALAGRSKVDRGNFLR